MTQDHWLTVATADTAVVAEILLNLRLATLAPPSKRRRPEPPQSWTIRQRRSTSKSEAPRASPTTPLSLSGGGGAAISDAVILRSKVTPSCETATQRPRKKKTLVALKREEVVLMEEQHHLKMKLAAVEANYEKQIKENTRLRKMMLDIQVEPQGETPKAISNGHFETVVERNDRIVLPDLNVPFEEDAIVSY